MFLVLKEILVVTISVFTALIASLGIAPEAAFAPESRPPAKIVFEFPNSSETDREEEVLEDSAVSLKPDPEGTRIPLEETPTPTIDPFQDLADAFAELAQESAAAQNSNQSGIVSTIDTNDQVRDALVNIICSTEAPGPVNPISGSGVLIDSRGVILTNAHVAQFFLLEDYPRPEFMNCFIRTGSPAKPMYTAELLFLPPSWIEDNAQKIDDTNPTGNGEHDWALLRITGPISSSVEMPRSFPHLPVALRSPRTGDQMLVAGYPAGFLGNITIGTELYAASANARVDDLYTFGTQSVDIFSIGGTVVAQQGSSGGAVANPEGVLTGVIVTSTDAPNTAGRDLRALATSYIVTDFENEAKLSLSSYLSGNLSENALAFRLNIFPTLAAALISVLEG